MGCVITEAGDKVACSMRERERTCGVGGSALLITHHIWFENANGSCERTEPAGRESRWSAGLRGTGAHLPVMGPLLKISRTFFCKISTFVPPREKKKCNYIKKNKTNPSKHVWCFHLLGSFFSDCSYCRHSSNTFALRLSLCCSSRFI